MKIKIAQNVVYKGKILKKDSVHDLPTREAGFLVDAKHAVEDEESAPQRQQQQQQQQPPKSPQQPPQVPPQQQ